MSYKEVLIVMDNELQLWWLLHFAHLWPYYIVLLITAFTDDTDPLKHGVVTALKISEDR